MANKCIIYLIYTAIITINHPRMKIIKSNNFINAAFSGGRRISPQCNVHHFIMFRDAFHGIQSLHQLLKYSSIAFNVRSQSHSFVRMETSLQLWNKVVLCLIKLACYRIQSIIHWLISSREREPNVDLKTNFEKN